MRVFYSPYKNHCHLKTVLKIVNGLELLAVWLYYVRLFLYFFLYQSTDYP